tara:strand:+ start:344 stop:985 length:642 start_codon:yes stop_codon:yes gene_type:complete
LSSLKDIRTDYTKSSISIENLKQCPAEQLNLWVEEASRAGVKDANAFCLSTINRLGFPTGRIVLARQIDVNGVVFYTNKNSAKGKELESMSKAGLTFFWPQMQRQVRLSGKVIQIDEFENDKYFSSRPRGSQIGAWASSQSEELVSRDELDAKHSHFEEKFQDFKSIPRPPHWGGYRISIEEIEFWQGRPSRLHDRVKYLKQQDVWEKRLLQP